MSFKDRLSVKKIETAEDRENALDVLEIVYTDEKGWVEDRQKLLPIEDIQGDRVEWWATLLDDRILGVTRVLYEIPTQLYKEYGFELTIPGLDVEAFIANNKIAEVGRFAVLPKYRKKIHVSAYLMRAAGIAAYKRGFTHFITDVFEEDPNTPYGFHRRVLGFQEVATHDVGELKCDSRRVTMLLDLREIAKRVGKEKGWFYRFLHEEARDLPEVQVS